MSERRPSSVSSPPRSRASPSGHPTTSTWSEIRVAPLAERGAQQLGDGGRGLLRRTDGLRAERPDVDGQPLVLDGADGRQDVRPGLAVHEGLDRELDADLRHLPPPPCGRSWGERSYRGGGRVAPGGPRRGARGRPPSPGCGIRRP